METIFTTPKSTKEQPIYPCVMVHKTTGCVVLFNRPTEGSVLHIGGHQNAELFTLYPDWQMHYFEPVPEGSSLTIHF